MHGIKIKIRWLTVYLAAILLAMIPGRILAGEAMDQDAWVTRFRFVPPTSAPSGVARLRDGPLPVFEVAHAAGGRQLVRVSLPFAPGTFPAELGLTILGADGVPIEPDLRILTYHPGRPQCVRRAIATFIDTFQAGAVNVYRPVLSQNEPLVEPTAEVTPRCIGRIGETSVTITADGVAVSTPAYQAWHATFIAPARTSQAVPTVEVIEAGRLHLYARMLVPDPTWPRIIEVQADALGDVVIRGHLQRLLDYEGRPTAPDLGWRIDGPVAQSILVDAGSQPVAESALTHIFSDGGAALVDTISGRLAFPDAHLKQRGRLTVQNNGEKSATVYLRCRAEENVPHQLAAWRTAGVVLARSEAAPRTAIFEPAHTVRIDPGAFDAIYGSGTPLDLSPWDWLERARTFHLDAIAGSTRRGDDFGNVTAMPESGVFGMNRLNHCPPIFRSYYRYSDTRLREVALLWCVNFHDSSIWWGETGQTRCGGTRYNNMARENKAYRDDPEFMWRSDTSVSFCTKGYDSFLLAYEETGDPRMATALYWQVEYARHDLHANTGECRNIGDVADFMNLYHFTGVPMYRDEAIRLFHELREKLSPGHLFSQGGQTIVADPPFIDDDQHGSLSPFAKPYIIGYALAGLPALAAECPDETELVPVIRAVARFLAESQDPVGGWRYPHPRSSHSSVAQGIEHAAQITRAAVLLEQRGEPIGDLLDALECTLQSRILVWRKTGSFFSGLGGWEAAGGLLKDGKTLYDLYARPTDRDRQRDYTEGPISIGGAPPEGVVYFPEVLAFYLAHRPAERLLHPNPQLAAVLERLEPTSQGFPELEPAAEYLPYGLAEQLPTFRDVRIERLTFPLRFRPEQGADFAHWRRTARAALFECLQTPPPRADFEPVVIGREDRGSYEARKIVFNVSTDCRILAYLLVPHGHGPFPAIVALHDHGAEFSIGKEKVIRPFGVTPQVAKIAEQWVDRYYGGRWYGDELARRGYVVFALDALFWGERGCKEGVEFERQQALAANLLQMGMTWSGVITWDDIRSAEFVASLPEVDPMRIGAVGLSMGSHRTWMLAAASDRIATGAAICWLGTTESLMAPGNNQTKGYSAYSMLVPNLRNLLDYPDTASIACPKPMIFFNGADDPLFPVQGVYDAYAILRAVWESQDCSDRLVTKIWPTGHTFNRAMQDEVFAWFDRYLP